MESESNLIHQRLANPLLPLLPPTLASDLVAAFLPAGASPGDVLEFAVILEGTDIPLREYAMYLALIDTLYGRLTPQGLSSYAHRGDWGRLQIAEIHKSDLEIIFRFYNSLPETVQIVVIALFLRSLPNMFKLGSEGVKNLAEAYKNYEEGRMIRRRRRASADNRSVEARIRETLDSDADMRAIPQPTKRRLTDLLQALFEERRNPTTSAVTVC